MTNPLIWICGQSGAGKTTLAVQLAVILKAPIVDADVYRKGWNDLGYSKKDRIRSCDNLLYEARRLHSGGEEFVIISAIAPYKEWRENQEGVKFIQVDHEGSKGREDDVPFEDIEGLTYNITL